MNKRVLLLIGGLLVLAAAFYAYREWNRDLVKADEARAEVSLTAEELFKAFTADEMGANARFNDKLVEVSGTVREVSGGGAAPVNVLLESGDPLGAVVCEFEAGSAPAVKKDEKVTIKGFCAGYNLDVLLQRCAVVER